jgi:SAM-dependent methyltransferase
MGSQAIQAALWGRNPAHWAAIQEVTSNKAYEYVLDQLQLKPSDALLDIGCGSGVFCSLAAARVTAKGSPANKITGFDATAPFLEEARKRIPEIDFVAGEMEALPFKDATFDIVTAFNSVQYAASVPNALKEAHRVLKPGGRLVTMIWGNKEDCEAATYLAAIGRLLPPPPPGAPGPFALSEDQKLETLLTDTGFNVTSTTDYPTTWDYPDLETALNGLLSAGPATRAIDHSGYQTVSTALTTATQPYLQPNGHIVYHNKFRIVMATR